VDYVSTGYAGRRRGTSVLRDPVVRAGVDGGQDGESSPEVELTITVTTIAASEVQRFMEEQGATGAAGLRVAVLPGGCSGFQYGLNIEDEAQDDDEIYESNGVRLFVDPFSGQYLDGVEIDYVTTMMGSGFTFKTPNATGGCGCGSSFTA
jgi:iron-sulfur cluster assembly protein